MHLERRADDEQEPCLARKLERALDGLLLEQLAEEDDVRLEDRAALRTGRSRSVLQQLEHARELEPRAAPRARRGSDRAVHLDHLLAAGTRVQEIDVLGHDRPDEPGTLEPSQSEVRVVRLGAREHREPRRVEAPHLLRVAAERLDRAVLERVELCPEPGRGAEVRDPALGRDPRAGEDDARLILDDQRRESLDRGTRHAATRRPDVRARVPRHRSAPSR